MPLFLAGFLGSLAKMVQSRIGFWAIAGLTAVGIQFATQTFVVPALMNQIQSAFTGAPAKIVEWFAFLRVDDYITLVMSAYAAAASTSALRMRKAS